MNIRAFFRHFQRWPVIRAVPPLRDHATAPRPRIRYVRACDLPRGIDASSVDLWRIDGDGEQWVRVMEGPADVV